MSKNPHPDTKRSREGGNKQPLKVLVISASDKEAAAIAAHLEEKNYQPSFKRVEDLYGLKKALKDKMWDLVISDYSMEGFHAHTAISYLKDCGWDIPLIVVSDPVGEEAAAECIRLGASDFMAKKNLSRLTEVAGRELKHKRTRDKLAGSLSGNTELPAAAKEIENKYRNLIDTLQEAYFEVDLEGRYTFVNNAMCDHLGVTLEELQGVSYRDLQSREDAQKTYRVFRQIFKTRKPVNHLSPSFGTRAARSLFMN